MGRFKDLLLIAAFLVCFLWLCSLTAIPSEASDIEFKSTGSFWTDLLVYSLPVFPLVGAGLVAFQKATRKKMLVLLVALIVVGIILRSLR
jgi:uncharacterized membrane protein